MTSAPASRPPIRNFRNYGLMEGANAVIVPLVATWFGWPQSAAGWLVLGIANLALITGLVVGTIYWLALDARLQGRGEAMARALPVLAGAQRPMLGLVILAALAVVWQVIAIGWSLTTGIAVAAAVLAGLEYVNYYHVQLQHFDNAADLKRLLTGRGLRPSHMARDLARWRRRIIRR